MPTLAPPASTPPMKPLLDHFDPALTGMEIVRKMLDEDLRPPMGETLDMRLVEAEPGKITLESTPDARMLNPVGTVHGGWVSTLLDFACGYVVLSKLGPGQRFTTLELKVVFHRALTTGSGAVRCEGTVVNMGRRVAFVEAKAFDAKDRLCASATSTLLVLQPGG